MTSVAALLLGAACLWAEGPASAPAAVLSPGAGRPVTARLTYDRNRAREGGVILVLPSFSESDAAAARLAEALILRSGGAGGRGAAFARGRRIPAVVPEASAWADGKLEAQAPVLGREQSQDGVGFQVAEKTAPVLLREGDVATVDPVRGLVTVSAAEDADSDLAAAEALRAYDGLRDGQALLHWWEARAQSEPAAGVVLAAGLAARLADGSCRAEDYLALRRAVSAALPGALKKRLSQEEGRVLREAAAEARRVLRDELASAGEAAAPLALDRILARAQPRWEGLQALAAAAGQRGALGAVSGLWKELPRAAAQRRQALASAPAGRGADPLAAAAAAAGAALPPRAVLGEESYRAFVAQGRLEPRIAEIAGDASLDLRRKSARIRSLLLDSRPAAGSDLGRDILARLPPADSYSVSGAYDEFPDVPRGAVLEKMVEAWAAGFDPGPLGARKRAARGGPPAAPDPSVTVTAQAAAEASGTVFSRDPASGSRSRVLVTVSRPGSDAAEELALDRRTGRELRPRGTAGPLTSEDLAVLARAARLLDDEEGRGVELDFRRSAGKLYLLGSRAIAGLDEEPARSAPFTVETPASADIEPVRGLR